MPKISSRGAAERMRAIADAASRWCDADFPARVRATSAIAKRTGYSIPVVEFALDRLFVPLGADVLGAAVTEELGSTESLDGFAPRAGGLRARAFPVGRAVIVASETTIGVALWPALFALVAGCAVLVKDREDALVGSFFATLAEESPDLGTCARAASWSGGEGALEDEALRVADVVVAFGRDATLGAIRARLRPGARFVGYGHRASIGYITREALSDEGQARAIARGAARDLVLYDAEGCMSLHALFVERGASLAPARLGEIMLDAVNEASVEFPVGKIDPRVLAYQTSAAFRAALGRGSVFRTENGAATLVVDPPESTPPPFLPRVLPIYSVDGPHECEEYVRSHGLALESIAVAAAADAPIAEGFGELAATLGAVRVTRLGAMQTPNPLLHHGGRARLTDFVRWVELE